MASSLKEPSHHVEFADGTVQLFDEVGGVRKIPIPTDDPRDPLTWPRWQRYLVILSITVYGITGFGVVQSTALFFTPIIGEYMKETRGQFNPARIGDLASYPSLCMGLGNFLFVPLSLAFGRRPLFIFCSALMVPAVIWAAKSTSFNSHLGARCLQGLIAGVADCLLPLIVLDVTFLHRRGFWMGLYWSATSLVTCLMLVCVPFLVHNNGENWRLNYWFWLGWAVLALILAIFGLRETLFYRETAVINGQLVICDAYGQVRFEHAAEGQAEEVQPQPAQVEYKEESFGKSLLQVGYRSPNSHFKTFLNAYVDLFICLTNPAIFWTLLLNSILFAGLVILSLTYEQALESPPWLFSAEAVGTAQIGSAIGSAAAFLLTGTVVERTAEALARRNGGVREPEHLLPSFAIPVILAFLGLVVYGVVGAHPFTMSWVGVHAGFALYYCGFIAISALSSMWIAELTPKRAGPAIVLICGGRNAASFGISHSFTPWLANMGFQNAHITLGAIFLGVALLAIPLYFINKSLRKTWTSFFG